MDSSGLGGGFLSGPNGGILDLELPIRRHQQTLPGHHPVVHHHHMNLMGGLGNDHQHIGSMEVRGSTPKDNLTNCGKRKAVSFVNTNSMSEEDEPSFTEDGNGENYNRMKSKKGSLWQRMKWTDNVVRLLIAVVAFVGDDGTLEGAEGLTRKSGILHKKGKWKTVSKIMISKGCYVSPQQCEDKFNDLNKRYKRLNEILGRGTSCRVVENPALMDSMPQLTLKMKAVVRKILSSKHLFYQEICAYHNGQTIPNCHNFDLQGYSFPLARCSNGNNGFDDEENSENDDCEEDELDEDEDSTDEDAEMMGEFGERKINEDGNLLPQSGEKDSFEVEMARVFHPTKSVREQKEWIMNRLLQLQEQRVSCQTEAFELEKRRFKWHIFRSKKDGELESLRLENERMKLENERMQLQLKQKELELDIKRPETCLDSSSIGIDRMQGRDQIDLGRDL